MALFGSVNDSKLMKHFSKEIIEKIVSIEISLYKLTLNDTIHNLYGESQNKVYYNPVNLFCLIRKDDKIGNENDNGIDYTRTIQFNFLRESLKEKNIRIIEGDIIEFDSQYWEIDNVRESQYWVGRNDETLINNKNNETQHGFNISVLVEAHLTKLSNLQIVETYQGDLPTPQNLHNYL